MKVILDIEANSLKKPTKIWLVVCKRVNDGKVDIFRGLTDDQKEKERFQAYARSVTQWIGHNVLEYDFPVLASLDIIPAPPVESIIDTLILSRLVNYSRKGGHSIEQYGLEFGLEKIKFSDWTKWSQEMEDYCVRDVEISNKVYSLFSGVISDPSWSRAISLEHRFQLIANDLHNNGFGFNTNSATRLLEKVTKELGELDASILEAFPPREVLIKEFTPKATKFGTISKSSVPRALHPNIHNYDIGVTYRHTKRMDFNPSSHKQLIEVLNEAGWRPTDKTQTHIDTERLLNGRGSKGLNKDLQEDIRQKLSKLKVSGWKINETNLSTLPDNAPEGARLLAKRILLESRRRTLTEWLGLVSDDGRIHGKFVGIGAWTHRMAHQHPNTANIPREFLEDGSVKLLGKEMRELWIAPKNKLLVGVDAEGIQLRIFAHYIDDAEFTDALVHGKKSDKSDPHSLNQRILGPACKTRQAAKRFIYALLLGGGLPKLAQILGCSVEEAKEALDRLLERYTGFAVLKKTIIPKDAKRGYFIGVDGRHVVLPGDTQRDKEHLAMSGYLQNGEAIVVKRAAIITADALADEAKKGWWKFVNLVHDELQAEVRNSLDFAKRVARITADAIREAGEEYKLKCPMAGSYFNDDINDFTIGTNWYKTH
jgi:DNA polymerase-1